MKIIKKFPFFSTIILLGIIFTLIGLLGRNGVYREYREKSGNVPLLASVFQGLSEGRFPWSSVKKDEVTADQTPDAAKSGDDTKKKDSKKDSGKKQQNKQDATESVNGQPSEETEEADSGQADEDKTYDFTTVDQSYFDDALFIGDSRTVGLHDYSGWDNATYYASIGLTVYDLFTKPVVEENGTTITIEQALTEHKFGKIYLMIGINEMGTGTIDSFMEAYQNAVAHLQELQPDAILFVEGIMYVKKEKSDTDPIFNNPNIQARNDRIAALADNKKIFYIDVNEVVTDETGNLNPEYTYDAVHLLGRYYSIWTDFLLAHGIVR